MVTKRDYLITGGAGFIGANLIKELLPQASGIRVLDNLSRGYPDHLKLSDVDLIVGDIRDSAVADRALRGAGVVIHLAAQTDVVDSVKNPKENFDINVLGTFNLLMASVRNDVQKFIFASTGAVAGDQEPKVHELLAPQPLSPYGAGKLAGEGYCAAFHRSYGIHTVCLRFSNIYGPFSYYKGSVISRFFRSALEKLPFTVYGDGTQTRDYLHAGDLSRAILLSVEKDRAAGEIFQIGSGQETSLNELMDLMKETVQPQLPSIGYEPFRKGEIYRNFSDINKSVNILGFTPETTLRDGLRETWQWFCEAKGYSL